MSNRVEKRSTLYIHASGFVFDVTTPQPPHTHLPALLVVLVLVLA